ncbi:PEGA domain-containing protein [Polyangium jinanense]|uniref:PEGA domain-containing protein n=1 Tax=Polyangium jinanense TaxID=2829994 RepID=A0A9X3X6Y4_9BACT|nr:PEGA domain-containing protein [Polyangium jinanense]MDC3957950.1 PEGA domain-containing protein [Polyangium jinanense]MDC3983503.1 PEGA domain-containing protein [Polyangium jinanense]
MKTSRRIALAVALSLPVIPLAVSAQQPAGPAAAPAPAKAEPSKEAKEEASRRFKRGIELFGEGDYRAALIEFRRANELAPNYNVLYNIGNVYFQLQDYANALVSFEKYLAEGGANIDAKRRADVDKDIEKLRTRVARVEIVTSVPDADVTIDDVPVGKSPFAKPLLVNPGRHRIVATKEGRTSASRTIEVASFDSEKVTLDLQEIARPSETGTTPTALPTASATPTAPATNSAPVTPPPPPPKSVPWAGWGVTGALAIGAVATGVLALSKNGELADLRKPDSGATKTQLDEASSSTATLALVSDIFTGAAVVAGAVTLYFTVRDPAPAKEQPKTGLIKRVDVGVSPTGFTLKGSF